MFVCLRMYLFCLLLIVLIDLFGLKVVGGDFLFFVFDCLYFFLLRLCVFAGV